MLEITAPAAIETSPNGISAKLRRANSGVVPRSLPRLNQATADAYLMLAAEIGDGFARPAKMAR